MSTEGFYRAALIVRLVCLGIAGAAMIIFWALATAIDAAIDCGSKASIDDAIDAARAK